MCLQVLALPPPTAGPLPPPPPPASTHPGTRPPFIPSTGVGNIRALGAGRGIVNGGPNLATGQPSVTDIAAGAILIASVVQGPCAVSLVLYICICYRRHYKNSF